MSKAVEKNEDDNNKILMRIQFILEVYVHRQRLQIKNFKLHGPLLWTGFTCLEVMCHYWAVDYFFCQTVTCNALHSKNSKYTIYKLDIRVDVSLCMRLCKQIIKKTTEETENVK